MLAMLITDKRNVFILAKGKKVRRDFGPGILETGFMFKESDIIYCHRVNWNKFKELCGWDLIEEDDSYILHNGSCWIFKERKSLLGSVIAQIFENTSMVNNLF